MDNEMKSPLAVQGLCKYYPAFRLEDVSFRLVPGTITGFIGRNGAGKTTTINAMLSFVRPDAGKIAFFGLDGEKTPAELSNGMKIKYALALALSHGAELLILDEPTSGLDPVSREELVEVFLKLKDGGKTVFFSTHITSDLEKCADRILFLQEGQLKADDTLEGFRDAWRIAECAGEVPAALKEAGRGSCRVRDGYTVLVRKEDAAAFGAREASLEEIMIHLEKEAEQA